MAALTKAAMTALVTSDFPDNNTGAITPAILRGFENSLIGSYADSGAVATSANQLVAYQDNTGVLLGPAAGLSADGSGNLSIATGTAPPAGGTTGAGLKISSTTNFGIFFGSGAPTLSAAQGSLYIRTDGTSSSTRLYVNTNGSTVWTNVVTAL